MQEPSVFPILAFHEHVRMFETVTASLQTFVVFVFFTVFTESGRRSERVPFCYSILTARCM